MLGAPRLIEENGAKALAFNGTNDGLVVAGNPLAGYKAFTIEICFRPAQDGPAAQRFLHLQDAEQHRALIETRNDGQGRWYLDTYLGQLDKGQALFDRARVHPTNRWYWVALRYDGRIMSHFVNGVKELEAPATFGPMGTGETSIGVRLNRLYWYKGAIREVRFSDTALPEESLQRLAPSP
jgi:hypothetical protein